jgi:hypothetical protein
MEVTDYQRYEICMSYARTMMIMAHITKQRYGNNSEVFISYVKQGIESSHLAIFYKRKWDEDITDVINIAA